MLSLRHAIIALIDVGRLIDTASFNCCRIVVLLSHLVERGVIVGIEVGLRGRSVLLTVTHLVQIISLIAAFTLH